MNVTVQDKADKSEIPSIDGLATQTSVDNLLTLITGMQTTIAELNTRISALENPDSVPGEDGTDPESPVTPDGGETPVDPEAPENGETPVDPETPEGGDTTE